MKSLKLILFWILIITGAIFSFLVAAILTLLPRKMHEWIKDLASKHSKMST